MASSKEYLEFILGQLSDLNEITYRAMMGEFVIYYRGKIVGGIYDDRLLVKPVKSAISYMPTVSYELPYEGAKEMLLVDEVDNKEFLTDKTKCDVLFSLKLRDQFNYCFLNRNIKSGSCFIQNNDFRFQCQCSRDCNTLTLSTTHIVRITIRKISR